MTTVILKKIVILFQKLNVFSSFIYSIKQTKTQTFSEQMKEETDSMRYVAQNKDT